MCEEFKDKNAPRAFMGKFVLGNFLGVDADAAGDLGRGAEGADFRRPAARLKAMRAALPL